MNPVPDDHQAHHFVGLVRVLNDLGNAAESVFARLYSGLSSRNKVREEADSFQQYQERAERIQERARRQTIEIARLTGILGKLDEGVIMQGADGRIILMNETARRLIGSTRHFWNSDLGTLFERTENIRPVDSQMQLVGEPMRVMVNEKALDVKLAAINDQKGEHLGTVMLMHDAAHQSVADKLKDSFIGQMSHELRTPLASIKGASEVLLNLPEGQPPNRKFLEAISRNVATLDRMVVQLIDISELSRGNMEVRSDALALDELTFTVLKGYEPRILKSHLHTTSMITNHRALQIQGDNRRLQWALGHLIDNAVNYTLPGGDIVIQMGKIRDQQVLLEIEDNGVGIQAKDLPFIFDPFYRGEARAQNGTLLDPRGLGQGLYIAQSVVKAHGGSVSVASVPGQGSTFTVALPL
ncbi:MAG: PAS domain-containing sensor histidine kinase [Anaerolineae bacterium]|nr:PAS domain-containing sensor histidine kinase [Anaerolineae bacterium]